MWWAIGVFTVIVIMSAWIGVRRGSPSAETSEPARVQALAEIGEDGPHAPTPIEERGTVFRAEYLSKDDETRLLTFDDAGVPNVKLRRERDMLVLDTGRGWINPLSAALKRHDVFCFSAAGAHYVNERIANYGLPIGYPIELQREPDNPHDPNAIALYAENFGQRTKIAYVNKGNAARLAKRLDAGETWEAFNLREQGMYLLAAPAPIARALRP